MALVQISYGKLAESLVRALLPTFLLTPFLVQTVTYSLNFVVLQYTTKFIQFSYL